MSATYGFDLVRERKVAEINSTARLYRHVKTGAELLSLLNSDENKVFGVSFATPPEDSTGVAHILEHSVLCGSRKYPIKEPFVELMKSSLNTFLNAMTFPDKTCYPVASQNVQDFYNLIDVYLDAVFFPRLTQQIFEQEGWHYEVESSDGPLVYKGVVFNEMKGNYSSPDSMLHELSQQSLYPDVTYGLDSGGDPKHIPNLTYEQLRAFHRRHYHPSNAKLFFYGDDDPEERLRLLDTRLEEFSRIDADFTVGLQRRFSEPKRLMRSYAAGSADAQPRPKAETPRETMVSVNWMLDEVADVETGLAFNILEHILIGTPAAPLYKALIDSGLGEGLAGGGLDDSLRQPMFSIGLKGIDPADSDKVETSDRRYPFSACREGHRSDDHRGRAEHRRIPPAREQYRGVPARHRLHAAGAAKLAAWPRSAIAARLRDPACRDQGKGRARRAPVRGDDPPSFRRQQAPHRPDPAARP